MSILSLDGFINFFKYYKSEPHQIAGITELYEKLPPSLKEEEDSWVQAYRTPIVPEGVKIKNPLDVPYQSQHDNMSGTGYRECFSSSCAMVAMYYGKVRNDDEYNLIRERYGDSTDAQAQIRALHHLGLEATFISNATSDDLKAQIDAGRPTPCGWLHKGHVSSPIGGGHYSVVIGYTDNSWIQNDPNGEAYLVSGGYDNYDRGDHVHYSFKNWNPRWLVEGEGSGWMLEIREPVKKAKRNRSISDDGIELIKSFEGLSLECYYCPSGVLTIGYGHTGNDVYIGQVITEAEAEAMLRADLNEFEDDVNRLIKVPITQNEFDAIVSFTFNTGTDALTRSTFRKRINSGEDKDTCFKEEFPRWVNGPDGPLPGLVRRREAEVKLACN